MQDHNSSVDGPDSDNALREFYAQLVDSKEQILCLTHRRFTNLDNRTNAAPVAAFREISLLPSLAVLDGELRPTTLSDSVLQSAWKYLSGQEAIEPGVWLRDDLRIAKLCLLEVERGTIDPWATAFWTYLGISYPKFLGILAEREAYARNLGPTLAEQLQDPLFLATLEPLARPFYSREQMRLKFKPESVPSPEKKRFA